MTVRCNFVSGVQALICGLLVFLSPEVLSQDYDKMRAALINEVRWNLKGTRTETGNRQVNENVLEVMGRVPRHEFVPQDQKSRAYKNRPLPIGYGQTISQPFIVALMTDMLEPAPGDRVLEVGTGSAYQAAVLAELVEQVYSIEIVEELGTLARARLARLGYDNVETRIADGYYGWEEQAPFDAIIVTAAASHIPAPLVKQIKPGGIMVIPVGARFSVQQLTVVRKNMAGEVTTRQILPVRFVPLTGKR